MVGSYPPPYGGQSIHILNLKNYLEENNIKCTVFNTGPNQKIKQDGVINISKMPLLLLELFKLHFDIVHVHVAGYQNFQKILPMLFYHYFFRKKWIITFHSGKVREESANPFVRRLVNCTIATAHNIICVNKEIKKSILAQGISASKCIINPAFSINSSFLGKELDENIDIFFKSHSPIISCVGMYEPQYGFETAISCFSLLKEKFPQIGCVFVCSGGGEKQELVSLVEQAKMTEHIIFFEDLPHDQCVNIIGKSDLFTRPTLYDGDAISVREALALGVPVVASNTSFRPIGTVRFEIADVVGMTDAIAQTLISSKRDKTVPAASSEEYLEILLKVYASA